MMTSKCIGKVIWRKPGESVIYSMTDTGSGDEFIIAPFKKNEKSISIKGLIKEIDSESINDFFDSIKLRHPYTEKSTISREYIDSAVNALDAIYDKKFEKVVLARKLFIENNKIKLRNLFMDLESTYKSAFVYCFALEDGTCMIGATPETLLEKKGKYLVTEALGGTKKTGKYTEKEFLEHSQIVSYIKNKLDGLGYTFSQSEPRIKQAGKITHLSTAFEAESKTLDEDLNLLHTLHPTPAVCGLPFEPAYEFIHREEKFDRNFYSGYLGIKSNSDFSFYVNLRCAEIFINSALLFAGAGLNKGSMPDDEWMETVYKMDTLLRFMM